jgi:hypothetical protein
LSFSQGSVENLGASTPVAPRGGVAASFDARAPPAGPSFDGASPFAARAASALGGAAADEHPRIRIIDAATAARKQTRTKFITFSFRENLEHQDRNPPR